MVILEEDWEHTRAGGASSYSTAGSVVAPAVVRAFSSRTADLQTGMSRRGNARKTAREGLCVVMSHATSLVQSKFEMARCRP